MLRPYKDYFLIHMGSACLALSSLHEGAETRPYDIITTNILFWRLLRRGIRAQ